MLVNNDHKYNSIRLKGGGWIEFQSVDVADILNGDFSFQVWISADSESSNEAKALVKLKGGFSVQNSKQLKNTINGLLLNANKLKEIEIINNKEMKLDETTVTRQSIHPKKPITKMAIRALDTRGINTQRGFLKITDKVTMNISSTPNAKYCKSLLMKLIMSEAIMAVPPK